MIELRHVCVHNLKGVDLDLPYGKMIVFCGRSGSGKSSLAMDTLYAEGQRRYIESFSAYTRQFLDKLEKPDAERIDGIPPAIAVASKSLRQMSRSTVGTATETAEYLRLLFAKIGRVFCPCCDREIGVDTPQSIVRQLKDRYDDRNDDVGLRIQIAFAPSLTSGKKEFETHYREQGFVRGTVFGEPFRLDGDGIPENLWQRACACAASETNSEHSTSQTTLFDEEFESEEPNFSVSGKRSEIENESEDSAEDSEADMKSVSSFFLTEPVALRQEPAIKPTPPILLILDRLTLGKTEDARIVDSLEIAMEHGDGSCFVLVADEHESSGFKPVAFSSRFSCENCGIDFPPLEPKLFSFNSPLGACPTCEGFGNLMMYDLGLIVPNKSKSIRGGAIAPWSTPSYRPKLDEFLDRAGEHGIPVDVPFEQLTDEQLQKFLYGSKSKNDAGLFGFFQRLERQKYKMHIRVFLSRWRNYRPCPSCHGSRLRREALSVRINGDNDKEGNGKNIAELFEMQISDLLQFFHEPRLSEWERQIARIPLEQVRLRLEFLEQVGLGYLALSRTMRTLSGGEQRRVGLTSALGSSLVDMLYVLDEPSIGLHPSDTHRLLDTIRKLRDRGNTVVVVEHEDAFLRAADHIVEIGPGAGESGGQVVFQGSPEEMLDASQSLTGNYLSGKRHGCRSERRLPENGVIEIIGCRGNNLRNQTVAFPLGMLCVVTGVSGAGKSSLVQETLYPALCRHFNKENVPRCLPFDHLVVGDQIEDVVMVDQSPIGRSPRSNPVTYLKIFDEIRNVFASTVDAKAKNLTAGKFSFNVEGGRCEYCKGDGYTMVDMQFMADMYVRCPQCHGRRYRPEILEILYRGRNIAEVLDMTTREAFSFFRGQGKVQQKLKRLIDVGLDYVRLGQPANTLSGGESQRLKLAAYLSQVKKERTLFLLDEPTTGLHFADIVQLLDCFEALIETGHSLVVVEHNLQLIRAADHVIDLGPGAAERGGTVVAQGTPEEIAEVEASRTGAFLQTSSGRTVRK